MLNQDILSISIMPLHADDSILLAKDAMNDLHVAHLPVIREHKLIGIISEDSLLNATSDTMPLHRLQPFLSGAAVQGANHILETVHLMNEFNLSVVPVINKESDYIGCIAAVELLKHVGRLIGTGDPGAIVVLELDKVNFSFAEINKLVETNDAQVTQLNTYFDAITSAFYITLRINKLEISDIIATFQRYEYKIKYYFGEEHYDNELRSNYNHLMNYLSI
ncbi:MAG: CBS domain-containing protein [Bacteroidota bacterium]|nr:CBS domain-containing protein [Bacteroidota bacterium]MDP4251350.1 CBS domain-containing protein [Bacteroidota bacterium]